MPDVDMRVELAGVTLKNPVCVASGTFGFGREYGAFYDLGELGAICAKGLTLHRREGNPGPRIAETPMGILNSVGLQNPGVDAFVETELPFLRQYDVKVIANISGNTPEEYGIMCEKLAQAGVDLIEVNISCPNVKAGGLAYGTRPELAAEVTQVAKAHAGSVPVMVKLSPNVTDITEIARAVAVAGADALSLINTLRGMRIDVNTRRPVLKMNTGGLSGPAVLPVAVRMVWEVAQAVDLPILGMGGVSKGEDAAQMMLAGASAVAVGTALFADPYAPIRVRDELAALAAGQGLERAAELQGRAARVLETMPDRRDELAAALCNLGELRRRQGRPEEAERCLLRALELFQRELGVDTPHYHAALNGLGGLCCEVGRYEEACRWFLAAAAAAEKLYGSEHREHRAALEHLRMARRAAEAGV